MITEARAIGSPAARRRWQNPSSKALGSSPDRAAEVTKADRSAKSRSIMRGGSPGHRARSSRAAEPGPLLLDPAGGPQLRRPRGACSWAVKLAWRMHTDAGVHGGARTVRSSRLTNWRISAVRASPQPSSGGRSIDLLHGDDRREDRAFEGASMNALDTRIMPQAARCGSSTLPSRGPARPDLLRGEVLSEIFQATAAPIPKSSRCNRPWRVVHLWRGREQARPSPPR